MEVDRVAKKGLSSVLGLSILFILVLAAGGVTYLGAAQQTSSQISILQSQVSSLESRDPLSPAAPESVSSPQTCSSTAGSTSVTLVAKPTSVQIAEGVTYDGWSFNGTIPGPTVFVKQCETVHFTITNNDTMPHSIDFHAAQVDWTTDYAPVAPGRSLSFDFVPAYPGVFMYHCGVPPVLEHIANGMYGVIIVNGTGSQALPPAPGGQYVLIESEFYLNSHPNPDGSYSGNYSKMLAATPDYVVFNGKAFQYMTSPLVVKPDQLVRLYVFNEGPSIWEAFHVIGGIMDTVYIDGNPTNALHGLQTVNIPPSDGAVVDMYFTDPGGENPFVNHAFAYAQKGTIGVFRVENGTSGAMTTTTTTTASVAGPTVSILSGSAADMGSMFYSPTTITVVIGVNNTITWANNDNAPHTVTANDGSFNSGNLNAGQSWTHTFDTPGTFPYYCSYHPWMKGTVIVKGS